MLNIALFGAPGAGKGTQSRFLIEKYDLVYIATGDILRKEIAEGSELGLAAKDVIEAGGLVSDEIIVQIIEKTIKTNPDSGGFLFDGFPRTFIQTYILEGLLLKMHTSLTCLLSLELPREEAIKRLVHRAQTSGRTDDTLEVINHRLQEYRDKTEPIAEFYRQKGMYIPIDGTGTIDEISAKLEEAVEIQLKKELFNVVLLGYPGAGRKTQARRIVEKYDLVCLSTGEILMEEVEKGTDVGKIVKPLLDKGQLVPDEIVVKLIEERITASPDARGFLFKGFPRTIVQAYILDGLLRRIGSEVSFIVDLSLPTLELIKRLDCRGKTDERMPYDMDASTIVERLEQHKSISQPLVAYYGKQRRISIVDGGGEPDEIFERICTMLEKAWKHHRLQ